MSGETGKPKESKMDSPEQFEIDYQAIPEAMGFGTVEELDAAMVQDERLREELKQEEIKVIEQAAELESNLANINRASKEERQYAYKTLEEAQKTINQMALACLGGATSLGALGAMVSTTVGDQFDLVQGYFHAGMATAAIGAAIFAIGTVVNKIKETRIDAMK